MGFCILSVADEKRKKRGYYEIITLENHPLMGI